MKKIILDGIIYDIYVDKSIECPYYHINFSSRTKNVCCAFANNYIYYGKYRDNFNLSERIDLANKIEYYSEYISKEWNNLDAIYNKSGEAKPEYIKKSYFKYLYNNSLTDMMHNEFNFILKTIILGNKEFIFTIMNNCKYHIPHFWLFDKNSNECIILKFVDLISIDPNIIDFFPSEFDKEKWNNEKVFRTLTDVELLDLKKLLEDYSYKKIFDNMYNSFNELYTIQK